MTNASDPSYPTLFSPFGKINEPLCRWRTSKQKLTHDAQHFHLKSLILYPREQAYPRRFASREPKKHRKRGSSKCNTLDTVMQDLPRSDLLDCLENHWETLKVEGMFAISHVKYSHGLWKGARNKFTDCIIILSSATWMLKTTFISDGDRSRRCEIWTAIQASLPKLRPNKEPTSRRAKVGKATVIRHTRNTSHIFTRIGPRRITSVWSKRSRRTCDTGDDGQY